MTHNQLSDEVLDAFPYLAEFNHLRQLASPVPLVPDTTFDIYIDAPDSFYALVKTDYVDFKSQDLELREISGEYEFRFNRIQTPFETKKMASSPDDVNSLKNIVTVGLQENTHRTYFYLVRLCTKH